MLICGCKKYWGLYEKEISKRDLEKGLGKGIWKEDLEKRSGYFGSRNLGGGGGGGSFILNRLRKTGLGLLESFFCS